MGEIKVLWPAIPLWVFIGFIVLAAVTIWAAPKGRRLVVAVPVVVFVLVTLSAAKVGRDDIAKERVAESGASKEAATEAHETRCQTALRLVDRGLADAARRELERAVAAQPDNPSDEAEASCQTALSRLAQAGDSGGITIEVRQDNAPAASDDEDPIALVDAVQVGVEHVVDDLLDRVVGGNEDARKQDLTMGPMGWLLLGGVVLMLVAAWVRLCFFCIRRTTVPRVVLASVVDADGESKTIAGFCAELRQRLFEHELQSGSTPSPTSLPDDVAGVVEESGVAGSKLASKILAVLFRLFGTDNNLKVDVTIHRTGNPRKAVVEMTDYRTGRTLTLQTVKAAGDDDQASSLIVRKVAAIVRNQALARLGNGQPPQWQDWTAEGLDAYLAGVDQEVASVTPVAAAEAPS